MAQSNPDPVAAPREFIRVQKPEVDPLAHEYGHQPKTPSAWFVHKFPEQADIYGAPIIEAKYLDPQLDDMRTKPIALNHEFFASILGGNKEMGHDVVYYEPDKEFYFYDNQEGGLYVVTSEAKLKSLLAYYLIHCAEEMPGTVDVDKLAMEFRSEKVLNEIIKKARSILAADESFFSLESNRIRKQGPETHQKIARVFIRQVVEPKPESLLDIKDCYQSFHSYCEQAGLTTVDRSAFKRMIVEIIREEFGVGLRSDLKRPDGSYLRGWKGLNCRAVGTLARN